MQIVFWGVSERKKKHIWKWVDKKIRINKSKYFFFFFFRIKNLIQKKSFYVMLKPNTIFISEKKKINKIMWETVLFEWTEWKRKWIPSWNQNAICFLFWVSERKKVFFLGEKHFQSELKKNLQENFFFMSCRMQFFFRCYYNVWNWIIFLF